MTVFDELLKTIINEARHGEVMIHVPGTGIRSYYLGDEARPGGLETLFFVAWEEANQALMIESGIQIFLTEADARRWRDNHSMEVFRALDVREMTSEQATHELSLLAQ